MDQNQTKYELSKQFFSTMMRIRRAVDQVSTVPFKEKLATMLQMHALSYIQDHPELTAGELANQLHMSSSAAAQLIDRLTAAQLITRKKDASDRRVIHLQLTKKGTIKLNELQEKVLNKMTFLLQYVSNDDIKKLIEIQTKILHKIESV